MATFTIIPGFIEHLCEKEHNLGSDQLVIALTNTAPGSETTDPTSSTAAAVLGNLTEVDYTYCSTRNITTSSSSQTSGTYSLVLTDLTLTASGGDVGPFRYIYVYNDTSTSDKLICYWDYGSSLTLSDGQYLDINFDTTGNKLFELGVGTIT